MPPSFGEFTNSQLDIEIPVDENGIWKTKNETEWAADCYPEVCYIYLYPSWIGGNRPVILWGKDDIDAQWKLANIVRIEDPELGEICRWWKGLYGADGLMGSSVTKCASY